MVKNSSENVTGGSAYAFFFFFFFNFICSVSKWDTCTCAGSFELRVLTMPLLIPAVHSDI
jgi:hypothetical protein